MMLRRIAWLATLHLLIGCSTRHVQKPLMVSIVDLTDDEHNCMVVSGLAPGGEAYLFQSGYEDRIVTLRSLKKRAVVVRVQSHGRKTVEEQVRVLGSGFAEVNLGEGQPTINLSWGGLTAKELAAACSARPDLVLEVLNEVPESQEVEAR